MQILITESQYKLLEQDEVSDCFSEWSGELPNAISYWKKWLSDPITLKKFMGLNKLDINQSNKIFRNYQITLGQIKISLMTDEIRRMAQGMIACIIPPGKMIYIDCESDDISDKSGVLVHEIQHILNIIYPLNPSSKVNKSIIGINPKTTNIISDINKFFKNLLPSGESIPMTDYDYAKDILRNNETIRTVLYPFLLSKKLSKGEIVKILVNVNELMDFGGQYREYAADSDENMSRIMGVRKLFNLAPNQRITFDMLVPYLMGTKTDANIQWLVIYWALNGFRNFDAMLYDLNLLAIKSQTIGSSIG
jgi:hypothetical protein